MEEEMIPKKKEEAEEIKEEVQNVVSEEVKKEEVNEYHETKKKGKIGSIISRIIWTIITLFLIFEVVMGILNMQKINEDKEPIWCFNKTEEKTNNKVEKKCNLGLYVIVKTKEGNEVKTALKPFFLK